MTTDKKIKVLTLSDHPMLPSGVATQTKNVITALLDSGKFQVWSFAGAIQHPNYQLTRTDEYGEDWTLQPVDGYGDIHKIRNALYNWKPDILYFMTDPRFYEWLWNSEDEIREAIPMVYYHVWDNKPYPTYNNRWYEGCDFIASISKVTSDIVKTVSPTVEEQYVPHAVDTNIFRKLEHNTPEGQEVAKIRKENLNSKDKFVVFWNNRNARRKQSGTLIFWFKKFLDKVGHDNAVLVMHTDPNDQHGQPLEFLASELGLNKGQVMFSTEKMPSPHLNLLYNVADVTVNISDAEGFGLGTLESLAAETPIIVTMTGGMQEQVTDGENWFGVGIEPSSKAIIGSQTVPYIYEDRINEDDFVNAFVKIYEMSPEERQELGSSGRDHVLKNYNFDTFNKSWVKIMTDVHEKHGSWDTRKNYQGWSYVKL